MKRTVVSLFVLPLLLLAVESFAGNVTITHTTAQSTTIQTTLIPSFNRAHCARFNLPGTCTTAQLVSAGCVNIVFKTVTTESCTIFTQDTTGEQAFLQERIDAELVNNFTQQVSEDITLTCAAWKAASQANKDTTCTTVGRPAGCNFCP